MTPQQPDDPFTLALPTEITERSVVRIGVLEAPISFHIRAGFVRQKEGRFFRIPGDRAHIPKDGNSTE